MVSVKELMRDFIDPASDYVFDAVGIVDNRKGTVETNPKTEADWEKIRAGGVMLAEGAALLKVPRPFAPDGDVNNSTGPDPEELSPTQIKSKLEADPVLWNAKIEALRNVGLEVLEIVKRKDAKELWDAADNLDHACESCHVAYWYPGEAELLKKTRQAAWKISTASAPTEAASSAWRSSSQKPTIRLTRAVRGSVGCRWMSSTPPAGSPGSRDA